MRIPLGHRRFGKATPYPGLGEQGYGFFRSLCKFSNRTSEKMLQGLSGL